MKKLKALEIEIIDIIKVLFNIKKKLTYTNQNKAFTSTNIFLASNWKS